MKRKLNYHRLFGVLLFAALLIALIGVIFNQLEAKKNTESLEKKLLNSLNVESLTIDSQYLIAALSGGSFAEDLTWQEQSKLLEATYQIESLRQEAGLGNLRTSSLDQSAVDGLTELLASYDFQVSVYFKFLDNNATYIYEPGISYYPASLLKIPLALYLYRSDEEETLSLSLEDRVLVSQMIQYSDNEATKTLVNRFQLNVDGENTERCDDFALFLDEIYVSASAEDPLCFRGEGAISGECDVVDIGHMAGALYAYFETQSQNAQELQQFFFQHDYDPSLVEMSMPLCKKYGQYDGALHDVALGYVPRPFILVVMTDAGNSSVLEDPDGIMETVGDYVEKHFLFSAQNDASSG